MCTSISHETASSSKIRLNYTKHRAYSCVCVCVVGWGGGLGGGEESRGTVTLDSEPSPGPAALSGRERRWWQDKEISLDTAGCVFSILRSSKSLLCAHFFSGTATVKPVQPSLSVFKDHISKTSTPFTSQRLFPLRYFPLWYF